MWATAGYHVSNSRFTVWVVTAVHSVGNSRLQCGQQQVTVWVQQVTVWATAGYNVSNSRLQYGNNRLQHGYSRLQRGYSRLQWGYSRLQCGTSACIRFMLPNRRVLPTGCDRNCGIVGTTSKEWKANKQTSVATGCEGQMD